MGVTMRAICFQGDGQIVNTCVDLGVVPSSWMS